MEKEFPAGRSIDHHRLSAEHPVKRCLHVTIERHIATTDLSRRFQITGRHPPRLHSPSPTPLARPFNPLLPSFQPFAFFLPDVRLSFFLPLFLHFLSSSATSLSTLSVSFLEGQIICINALYNERLEMINEAGEMEAVYGEIVTFETVVVGAEIKQKQTQESKIKNSLLRD